MQNAFLNPLMVIVLGILISHCTPNDLASLSSLSKNLPVAQNALDGGGSSPSTDSSPSSSPQKPTTDNNPSYAASPANEGATVPAMPTNGGAVPAIPMNGGALPAIPMNGAVPAMPAMPAMPAIPINGGALPAIPMNGAVPAMPMNNIPNSADPSIAALPANATVCCESFGYGAMMVKCCESYAWVLPDQCSTEATTGGGGKKIVDDSLCSGASKP